MSGRTIQMLRAGVLLATFALTACGGSEAEQEAVENGLPEAPVPTSSRGVELGFAG